MKKLLSLLLLFTAFLTTAQTSGGEVLGNVPNNRTITINGVTQNLAANRTWNVTAASISAWSMAGNTVAASTKSLGTLDAFDFDLITNGARRITFGLTGIITNYSTSATSTVAGTNYFSPTLGHVFNITDNNSNGLTVKNGTVMAGFYVASSGSQPSGVGSINNSPFGMFANFGTNAITVYTNNFVGINTPSSSYSDAPSPLSIRANATTNSLSALGIRNSVDNANIFGVFNDGHVAIGNTIPVAATLRISSNHTGGSTATGIFLQGTIAGDVTTAMRGVLVQPSYTATSVSVGTYQGMLSGTPSVGTNTITTLTYFDTGTELTNVSGNTYGYFSRIGSGTNRWNFYANGTADNYFSGSVGIATTTPTEKLHVVGNGLFSGSVTSPTVYGSSASGGNLSIMSTSNATKGNIILGSSTGSVSVPALAVFTNTGITVYTGAINVPTVTIGTGYIYSGSNDQFYNTVSDHFLRINGVDFARLNGQTTQYINGTISLGTNVSPAASAVVDIVSTTKGFLPPRMTATQASAISSPAEGLMVYVTDTNGTFTAKGWWGYDGAAWQKLNN